MARAKRLVDPSIVVLSVAIRIAAVLVLRSYEVPRSTYEHGEIAANLLAGRGFTTHFLGAEGPTSQQAPVYPLLVALAYVIGGVGTPRALLILELGQSVLGGFLVWEVMRLARLAIPGRPWLATTAALVVAIHPTLVYAATHVQVASLGALLLVGTLARAYQAGASGRIKDAVITGIWLALLALTDPILSLAFIGVAGAIGLGRVGEPRALRYSSLLILVTVMTGLAGISPWLVRNAMVHREFVAIKSTFGYAFWQGNCTLSEGTDKVRRPSVERVLERSRAASSLSGLNRSLWEARHEAGYLDDIALNKADYRLLGSVSEPERSRILFRRAMSDLRAEPMRYVRLSLRRLRYFILFDETNPKSRVLAYRLAHVGLTLFALVGLVMASPSTRRRLLPTITAALAITAFHALTIVSARFHIPIEPIMAIWGASGLTRWGDRVVKRSTPAPHHIELVRIEDRLAVIHLRD
ncbi:MAG: hypothetical protein ACLQGP_30035 [Isosphaeraceae bacterium]